MNKTRTLIKKIIYKVLGEKTYRKAYVKGKVLDIKKGVLDEVENGFLHHFIHSNSTVLDIGANYGHYAVDMSKLCYNGLVIAFEPVPFTFNVLKNVVSKFKYGKIQIYHNAVSNTKSQLEMVVPLLDFGAPNTGVAFIGATKTKNSKTVKVNSIVIDDFNIPNKVDFIKIDIEGHEPSAFEGMKKLLKSDKPTILIEFSFPCLKRANFEPDIFSKKIMNEFGYVFTSVDKDKLSIVKTETPGDGYYFLIHKDKINTFKAIIKDESFI